MNEATPHGAIAEVDALLERRRTGQAKARLAGALRQWPDNTALLVQAGWADFLDDDHATARATVERVLAREPELERARYLLFELELEAGKLPIAEELIIGLLGGHPRHAPYYGRYARLMLKAMHVAKARDLAVEGLNYDTDDPGCLGALTLCDIIENRSGATSLALQKLVQREPDSLHTLALVMVALNSRGDKRGAYRVARALVTAQPDNTNYVAAAAELRFTSHWSMLPLWPMQRWGWSASIAIWLLVLFAIQGFARIDGNAAAALTLVWLVYVIYSWVWPRLLRRWITHS